MFDTEGIPKGLDGMAPGPVLGAILTSIDVTRVSGHDRVVVLRAHQRMASHYQAQVYADMAAVTEAAEAMTDDPEIAADTAASEVRAALRLTRRASDAELELARDLNGRLPGVWSALARGDIDLRRARTIAYGTSHLDDDVAAIVANRVLSDAPDLTTGQLRARLRRICMEADPEDAVRRYRDAVSERRLVTAAGPDGTAMLAGLDLPPHRVQAVCTHINRLALSLGREGETRTIDQLRADIFLDLLMGRSDQFEGKGSTIEIRVDLATLAELSDRPGDLAGYGPVVADIARRVARERPRATWRYAATDDGGGLAAVGTTRRRPNIDQRRRVESRNSTCVFPGCRMPASQCDLDHIVPWAKSNRTDTGELAPLCRHDHRLRHATGWDYRPIAGDRYEWISPMGHTYLGGKSPP